MKKIIIYVREVYGYFLTFPDKLYPFSEEIEGERVRWQQAYDQALAKVQEKHGYGHYGPALIFYRNVFHLIGAVLFVFFSALISHDLFGSEGALYLMFSFAAGGILYSELFVQPKLLGQKTFHAFIDWFSWVVPMVVYIYAHTHGIELRDVFEEITEIVSYL